MRKKLVLTLSLVAFSSAVLWAGGWNNMLIGCRAIAIGGAFAGIADDASAIYYNPAGLAFQEQNLTVTVNGFNVWPTYLYSDSLGRNLQSKSSTAIPQVFLAFKSGEKWTLGFGVYVPYAGGGVEWDEKNLGLSLKSYLGIVSFTPTLAYEISDKVSLGLNFNIYKAVLEDSRNMEPLGNISTEENGTALSLGLGLMLKPSDRMSIGAGIRGPAKMKLSGKTTIPLAIPDMGTFEADFPSETKFNLPWDFELGISYRISSKFLMSTSAQYTMWSALDTIEKTLKNVPEVGDQIVHEPMNFKDILLWRIGAEYWISDFLSLRAGVGFDRWATPEESLNFDNIDVDKFTLLGGIGYRSGRIQIDLVYAYAQGKEREKLDNFLGVPVQERFNLNTVIFGLGITYSY
jgi:long-chain fatty acid transport protein